jgi:hypothetical protein
MPRITPTVKQILIGLLVAYVAQLVLENWFELRVFGWLAMTPGALLPWQLVTYVAVDRNNPLMFLITLLFTSWSLTTFDLTFGPRRTLQLCLASVLGASVPAWIVGFALDTATPLYGATPLLYGGIAAMCWLDLSRPVSLFGALTMTAQQLLLLLVGIAVLMFLFDKNVIHLVGELGALGGGILYARWLRRPRTPRKPPPSRRPPRSGGFKVIKGGQDEKGLLH